MDIRTRWTVHDPGLLGASRSQVGLILTQNCRKCDIELHFFVHGMTKATKIAPSQGSGARKCRMTGHIMSPPGPRKVWGPKLSPKSAATGPPQARAWLLSGQPNAISGKIPSGRHLWGAFNRRPHSPATASAGAPLPWQRGMDGTLRVQSQMRDMSAFVQVCLIAEFGRKGERSEEKREGGKRRGVDSACLYYI